MKINSNLSNCRACEKLVAVDAKTCPHCGSDSPVTAFLIAKMIGGVILVGIFILFNKQIMDALFWVWGKALF